MRLPPVAPVAEIDVAMVAPQGWGRDEGLGLLLRAESVPSRILKGAAFTLRVVPRIGPLGWRGVGLLVELTGEIASIAVGGCLLTWDKFTRFRELAARREVVYLGLASTEDGDAVWFRVPPAEIVARSGLARLGERLPLLGWALAGILSTMMTGLSIVLLLVLR